MSTKDPLMTDGLVSDSHPFFDARFACRELQPFRGIELDWTRKTARQSYDSRHRSGAAFADPKKCP
jgi:hypothetical protein